MAVLAEVCSAASVAALAFLDSTRTLTLPVIVFLAAAGGLFDIPGMTARQTLLPRIAERSGRTLDAVASIRQGIFGLSLLAGPALTGVLLGAFEPGKVLWMTAACSALAAVATLAVRVPLVVADDAERGIGGAWRTVRRRPVLVKLLLVITISSLVTAPLTSVLLPSHFSGLARPDWLGYTSSALAVGLVVGTVAYAVLARSSRRVVWLAALTIPIPGLTLIALLDGFWLVAIGAALLGLGAGLVQPLIGVVFAERVPGSQLGRVMGLANALGLVAGPLALGATALLVDAQGLAALAWAIVGTWVIMALIGITGRDQRDLEAPTDTTSGATRDVRPADSGQSPT
jgi:MFS family permease